MIPTSIIRRLGWSIVKQEATYLDGKHTGFDYHEYDMSKFGTAGCAQNSLDQIVGTLSAKNTLRILNDQARQGIHSNGQGETC